MRCANRLRSEHADIEWDVSEVKEMRYSIPEINMESLEKKLTRIGNKCRKYGCEFKFERVGEHFETRNDDGQELVIKYIDVDVEGTAIINGWRFVATLDYTDKGNVIQRVGDIEVPDRYYSCKPWCEHCKTRRDRKNSFIVLNEETGEFKQVGRSCLKDFTHGMSAEWVAQFESFMKDVEDASENIGSGWMPTYYNVKEFMACVAESIRLYGYVKRDGIGLSTVNRADEIYSVEHNLRLGIAREEILNRYQEAVDKGLDTENPDSLSLVEKVVEWVLNVDKDDNYYHNLKVACSLEYGDYKVLGLLASAFPTYDREIEYEAERRERALKEAEARAKSSWMGEIGDKVSFVISDFRCITSWETQWGMTHVYKFVDEDGREATWKTGNWVDERCIGKTIAGKIKELKEFRGVKQTELVRCRVA